MRIICLLIIQYQYSINVVNYSDDDDDQHQYIYDINREGRQKFMIRMFFATVDVFGC